MCGVKKEIGGTKGPHDAHDAGSWGAAGALKCFTNKTLKIRALGSGRGCKYQCWKHLRCVASM